MVTFLLFLFQFVAANLQRGTERNSSNMERGIGREVSNNKVKLEDKINTSTIGCKVRVKKPKINPMENRCFEEFIEDKKLKNN